MSLDAQLDPDLMKKEPEPSYNRLRTALRRVAKGVGIVVAVPVGLYAIFLGLAAASGTEIVSPWTPPRVEVFSDAIRVESRGYTGPHLKKDLSTGAIKIEWFEPDCCAFFSDFPIYVDRDGDGLVDKVVTSGGGISPRPYKRYDRDKNDAVKNPDVFARANKEFEKVMEKYRPYILQAERSIH